MRAMARLGRLVRMNSTRLPEHLSHHQCRNQNTDPEKTGVPEMRGRVDLIVTVNGGGITGQAGAVCQGVARGRMAPLAKSLSPRPPQFVIQPAQRPTWMDAYVIQHGIRWSGMPAFRGLSEADTWRIALYVEGRTKPKEE